MKVVYTKPMIERIATAVHDAEVENKTIEKIVLDLDECRRLRAEGRSLARYCASPHNPPVGVPSVSLLDYGRRITKGDWCMVYGVRVEAGESQP